MANITYLASDSLNQTPVSAASPLPTYAAGATYALLSNASATGGAVGGVRGGAYIWTSVGTWNAATATLQSLGPDGVTWLDVDTLTANGRKGVVIGENATVRVALTGGPPAGVYSSLS